VKRAWSGLVLVATLSVAACVPGPSGTERPGDSSAATIGPSVAPAATPSASQTTRSPSPAPPSPSDPPASASPEASTSSDAPPASAAACTGSDDNRRFFGDAAADFDWSVYCPVLPAGWFVESGMYREAGGGRLEIAYRGPGGARIEIDEGAFCGENGGCVPPGTDRGEATFGDRTGTLVALDDGGWAIVVDRGKPISWLLVASGLGESGILDVGRSMATVAD
jgi:hypothetical protein